MDPMRKVPTLADLDALPPGMKGEIIEGVLYTMTRPRGPHQRASIAIGIGVGPPFDFGENGPQWLELGTWGDERDARIPPFDAVAIDISRCGV